jgi:hydrogenase maturation factor HypF (carbamoyltransferase family)
MLHTNTIEVIDGAIFANIYNNGNRVIVQDGHPYSSEKWATEAEAKAWADDHCAQLDVHWEAATLAAQKEQELKDTQLAALKAQIDSAAALTAILEKLTNPTA